MKTESFVITEIGPRNENEDSAGYKKTTEGNYLACIADGVGGANCGAEASQYCVERFLDLAESKFQGLLAVITQIHAGLHQQALSKASCKGMASTLTGFIFNETKIVGVHVGDSRLYVLRGNGLKQLTVDQTEANVLVQYGVLDEEAAKHYSRRNILESALGSYALKIHEFEFEVEKGDRLILSTDGFHGKFSKTELRDLSTKYRNIIEFKKALEDRIALKDLRDNCTCLVTEME